MKAINVYLTFDGNCRQAMEFYKTCFGGELFTLPFSEGPPELKLPKKSETLSEVDRRFVADRHAAGIRDEAETVCLFVELECERAILLPLPLDCDVRMQPDLLESSASVSVDCDTREELERIFAAVGKRGKVTMPLQDTFWGARFGMIADKFGISWMLNLEKEKQ